MIRFRHGLTLVALTLVASLLSAGPAGAGEPIIPTEASFVFKRYDCVLTDSGFVARGQVRTNVSTLRKPKSTYYQKVTVQIDKLGLGQQWRKMESRTYDWSKFTQKDLPTYSTSGVKTAVGAVIADGGFLSVKVKVKLKRVVPGPDFTTWSYERRSPTFQCSGDFREGRGAPG